MIEQRNMAGSDIIVSRPSQAVWSDWTVSKAVAEGYKATSWVYRAVSIIATNASSVPWVVFGKDNQAIWEHPISKLLDKPNPFFTRQQLIELIVDWLALAGNGYLKIVTGSRGDPQELWPVSPDRIAPRPSSDPAKFIDGYEVLDSKGVRRLSSEYTPENTAHFKLMNPANPYAGISPLMAAARAADLDNAQQEWNVSVMQNRAVPEGLFTFKRDLDETLFSAIVRRLKERMSGTAKARDPMVVGSEATYTRLGLSPVELDYLESRKFSRDEMYIVYGIPPQLGGAMEASTYNNFAASMRIFWETTLIPTYLDKIKDGLNAALSKHLQPGQYICYDLSTIAAMRDNDAEKAGTAKLYVDMGVPFAQINEKYELGFEPWEGWDRPTPKQSAPAADPTAKRWKLRTLEQRGIDAEIKARDDYAEGPLTKAVAALLEKDRMAVFAALESGAEPAEAAKLNRKAWQQVLQTAYMDVATDAAARLLDAPRSARGGHEIRADFQVPPEVEQAVNDTLQQESTILRELSLIEASTVRTIIEQVVFATQADPSNVLPVSAIQQALTDTGVFSPVRALRIARTVSGAAMGIGQMTAGQMAGATHKTWHIAGANTRDAHVHRSGETVTMAKRFSAQVGMVGPRFPCDPDVAAADRIACRCALTFSTQET